MDTEKLFGQEGTQALTLTPRVISGAAAASCNCAGDVLSGKIPKNLITVLAPCSVLTVSSMNVGFWLA